MKNYYEATTFDVCQHKGLYWDMNEYDLDPYKDIYKQVSELAKKDRASVVEVLIISARDFNVSWKKKYYFKEYDCACHGEYFRIKRSDLKNWSKEQVPIVEEDEE